jgi:hypothetical protein
MDNANLRNNWVRDAIIRGSIATGHNGSHMKKLAPDVNSAGHILPPVQSRCDNITAMTSSVLCLKTKSKQM